jgi:NitT/TauT family transport system permease protein
MRTWDAVFSSLIARFQPRRLLGAIPFLVFLAAWQVYGGSSSERTFFYSTPRQVAATLLDDLREGALLRDTALTAGEALAGFVLGNLVGAVLGIGLWYSESVARLSKVYIAALGAFPIFAIAPMTVLWFGIGVGAKVALAFLATVFLAIGQAYKGVEQVDPLLRRRFRVFGASRWRTFIHLLVPSSAIWIISSLRLTIGSALLGAFIGEFIASERGLGHMIIRASGLYDTPQVLVGVLTMVALAVVLDAVVDVVERVALRGRLPA